MYCVHQREAWNHSAYVAATIINCNRDPRKGRQKTVEDLNPWIESADQQSFKLNKDNFHLMKGLADGWRGR